MTPCSAARQRQPAAFGEAEQAGLAADLGGDGGEAAAAEPLLENPEGILRAIDADHEERAGSRPKRASPAP